MLYRPVSILPRQKNMSSNLLMCAYDPASCYVLGLGPQVQFEYAAPKSGFPSNRPQADGKASQTSSAKHETTDCLACTQLQPAESIRDSGHFIFIFSFLDPPGALIISVIFCFQRPVGQIEKTSICPKMLRITTCWSKKRGRFFRLAVSFI